MTTLRTALISVAAIAFAAGAATGGALLWRQHEAQRPNIVQACLDAFPITPSQSMDEAGQTARLSEACQTQAKMHHAEAIARWDDDRGWGVSFLGLSF